MGKRKNKESGQALIEYILLLTIVFGFVIFFVQKLTGTFDTTTLSLGGKMERQLRTGAAPASLWTK
ncbi:MAG: hypothetical protein H7333_01510 [Bdellovibrionales bacterium]|nr:hypothetical protein [Oligoflexia bacterium]